MKVGFVSRVFDLDVGFLMNVCYVGSFIYGDCYCMEFFGEC